MLTVLMLVLLLLFCIHYWHCPEYCMRSKVCETVERPSVRPSVPSAAGLQLWARLPAFSSSHASANAGSAIRTLSADVGSWTYLYCSSSSMCYVLMWAVHSSVIAIGRYFFNIFYMSMYSNSKIWLFIYAYITLTFFSALSGGLPGG